MAARLSQDEIDHIAALVGVETLPIIAAVAHAWRCAALPLLSALGVLRPSSGCQRLACGMKSHGPKGRPEPTFLTLLPSGDVLLAESSAHRLTIWSATTGLCCGTIGSFGVGAASDGLNYPKGVAVDDESGLYVADRSNHRVVKFSLIDNGIIGSVGGGRGRGVGRFRYPQGVAFARETAHGPLIFVSDYGNDRIVALDKELNWRSVPCIVHTHAAHVCASSMPVQRADVLLRAHAAIHSATTSAPRSAFRRGSPFVLAPCCMWSTRPTVWCTSSSRMLPALTVALPPPTIPG